MGWPGYDPQNPTLPDGWDWQQDPTTGELNGDLVKHNPDGSEETLHPDLDNQKEGPHWDYGIKNVPGQKNRSGKIWPNANDTGGTLVWNESGVMND